jgi:AraC-like DNA-binding protein
MNYQEPYQSYRISVPPEFEEVFSHFYYATNNTGEAINKTLVPSYQTIMVFSFGEPVSFATKESDTIRIDKCLVIGPIKQAVDYILPPNAEILVANFIGDAFFRFFGIASIAAHKPMHPDELLHENCFTALWSVLANIKDAKNQVNHILEFCRPYLQVRNPVAEQIANFYDDSKSPIKAISAEYNLSERAVQLNHKKYLGYSAKEISRYQRFLKAIHLIQSGATNAAKIDWFEIINECGYYDQSQMIHDFKHYLGLSPSKYLQFQQRICIARD